ncbi:MAG: transporter substrate-binding domain-containing protein [Alphaproteobacteria bacterium]|nr:transporter substrate-binding domain-containing protein [Alphaproteobacteria bacterium]
MRLLLWFLAGLSLLSAGCQAQTLELFTEENPPLNFTDETTGQVTGAATELLAEILSRANVTYSIKSMPWARAFREAKERPGACAFAAVRSPDREQMFEWVGPLFTGGWALYKRPGSSLEISDVAKLDGLVVAAMGGTAAVTNLQKMTSAEVVLAPRDDVALALLYHGRADLWLSGVFAAPHSAKKARLVMPELALIWRPSALSLACGRGTDPALIARLNEINSSLDVLRRDLMQRYRYGYDTEAAAQR